VLQALPQFQVVALADPVPANLDRGASLAPGAIPSVRGPMCAPWMQWDNTPKEATAGSVGSAQDAETCQQYLAFACSRRLGRPPAVTPEDGKTATKLVLVAETSMRTRRIMNWNDLPA